MYGVLLAPASIPYCVDNKARLCRQQASSQPLALCSKLLWFVQFFSRVSTARIPVEITQEDLCHQFVVPTRVLTTCALTERPAPPPPQSLTQRYHRSRVSIKKGLLQKGRDHMLWSKITTHYLQSCNVFVDLAIAFCGHNCLNKS